VNRLLNSFLTIRITNRTKNDVRDAKKSKWMKSIYLSAILNATAAVDQNIIASRAKK